MKRILYVVILLCFSVNFVSASDGSWGKKKKKKDTSEKVESKDSTLKASSESAYEKFIKDAEVKRGMFNVIKKKDKIYLEIPKVNESGFFNQFTSLFYKSYMANRPGYDKPYPVINHVLL